MSDDPATARLLDSRLVIVTGKGGVGKSTVAATLALAGARSGRRTCLVEIEGRQAMPELFETPAWDFTEQRFRPDLWGLAIDPEDSLREYLDLFYGVGRMSRLVVGSSAVQFATTAAPGVRDVLLIGKVKEMEQRRNPDGRFTYDLIVLDAPPTGRIVNFLRAPEAAGDLVSVGPIKSQARSVVDMLLDPARTRVHLVTLLEEMPVQETAEAADHLTELGVAVGPVFANRVEAARIDAEQADALDRLDAGSMRALLEPAGLRADDAAATALLALGHAHRARLGLQAEMRARLRDRLPFPLVELPTVHADRFGPDQIGQLADHVEPLVAP